MMKQYNLVKEAAVYFHQHPEYTRILKKIKEKYISLGRLGGYINLNNITMGEKNILAERMNCFASKGTIKVDVSKFVRSFQNTRFSDVNFEEVLKEYFSSQLETKKQFTEKQLAQKNKYFNLIINMYKNTRSEKWLRYMLDNKKNAYTLINRKYISDPSKLEEILIKVCDGLNNLNFDTSKFRSISVFSSEVTKEPHTFDFQSECGKLLVYGICYFLKTKYPDNMEKRSKLLYNCGIIIDEISNYSVCFGVIGFKGKIAHSGWQGFTMEKDPINVSLRNLGSIDILKPLSKNVYVFENPAVFSEVLCRVELNKVALVCTSGQLNLASLILLDKLIDNVEAIYYAGDFDPEGILIADKLSRRYGDKLRLWRYTAEDYKRIKSEKKISSIRLKQLGNVIQPELQELKEVVAKQKVAAYQELLIQEYVHDIFLTER
jgi:uncharacterized protein (TIGR02679 family)